MRHCPPQGAGMNPIFYISTLFLLLLNLSQCKTKQIPDKTTQKSLTSEQQNDLDHINYNEALYPYQDVPVIDNIIHSFDQLKVAFGSCNDAYNVTPLWPSILAENPDIWIWMGDNIYADTRDPNEMKREYNLLKSNHEYSQLRSLTKYIWGVWDDHDYGENDAGKYYPMKNTSQQLFLDFLDFPAIHPNRTQLGIFQTYAVNVQDKLIRFILFDTRFFRDDIKENGEGDILGESQWNWFEKILKLENTDIFILVSSIQLIPTMQEYEKWENFPKARQKLLNLFSEYHPKKTIIILSGDRHHGEISYLENKSNKFYEITSSGMSHYSDPYNDPNHLRVGKPVFDYNYGSLELFKIGNIFNINIKIHGTKSKIFMQYSLSIPI